MMLSAFASLTHEERALVAPSIGCAYERTVSGRWRMRLLSETERRRGAARMT